MQRPALLEIKALLRISLLSVRFFVQRRRCPDHQTYRHGAALRLSAWTTRKIMSLDGTLVAAARG